MILKRKKNLRKQAEESFQLLAEYIERHKLKPKYILGVSYERLANLTKYFGFQVIEIPIPEEVRSRVEKVYQKLMEARKTSEKQPKPMGKILVCYMKTENFLERFSKQSK